MIVIIKHILCIKKLNFRNHDKLLGNDQVNIAEPILVTIK